MRKALVIARSEFQTAIRSRAFIISLLAMPILSLGSILAQRYFLGRVDTEPKACAVIDHSGRVWDGLAAAAKQHNAEVAPTSERPARGGEYRLERVEVAPGASLDETRLALSERVRKKELFAFIEIPANAAAPDAPVDIIRYYSNDPTKDELREWLERAVTDEARRQRFAAFGADPAVIDKLQRPVPSIALGLFDRAADGSVAPAKPVDRVRTFVVPMVLMFIIFMVVMTSAPMLLNSVLEEKMSRISEVLLGSVTPFELMLGKLLGSAGVSLVLGALYVGGGIGVARYLGYGMVLPVSMLPLLLLFLVLAMFFYGSLYIAVGSACTELKDAQSLMMPIVILTIMPMMVWTAVLRDPNGSLAVGMSLFPPATPFLMLLRMALQPGPPLWQVALSLVLTAAATVGCVWAAGKIFRIGVLSQGKSATFTDMVRWVLAR
jgi:ABC-type Na+ efflux pump permease subunit